MLDIFNKTILDNVWKNRNKVIQWLKEINDKLIIWNLDKHKKKQIVKWLWIVKLYYPNDKSIQNIIASIAEKLKIKNELEKIKL
jgi:uncharacterized protein YfkK (UPF0435 family)